MVLASRTALVSGGVRVDANAIVDCSQWSRECFVRTVNELFIGDGKPSELLWSALAQQCYAAGVCVDPLLSAATRVDLLHVLLDAQSGRPCALKLAVSHTLPDSSLAGAAQVWVASVCRVLVDSVIWRGRAVSSAQLSDKQVLTAKKKPPVRGQRALSGKQKIGNNQRGIRSKHEQPAAPEFKPGPPVPRKPGGEVDIDLLLQWLPESL